MHPVNRDGSDSESRVPPFRQTVSVTWRRLREKCHMSILRGRIVSTQTRSVTFKFNSSGEILLDKPTDDSRGT